MELIPALDILDNQIVHARLGLRKSYRPILSRLSDTSDPIDIIDGLLSLHPFKTFYIADINSILSKGNNAPTIKKIVQKFSKKQFWLDSGASDIDQVGSWIQDFGQHVVVVSESQKNLDFLSYLKRNFFENIVLSLDFDSKNQFIGPKEILEDRLTWPTKVIFMTLSRVGSNRGPDLEKIQDLIKVSNRNKIYTAGGVRNLNDLQALRNLNISGSLLATSLHDGSFTSCAIKDFV